MITVDYGGEVVKNCKILITCVMCEKPLATTITNNRLL